MLEQFELSGAAREDIGVGARRVVVGSYVTLYRVVGEAVEIVRIFHGSRDFRAAGYR